MANVNQTIIQTLSEMINRESTFRRAMFRANIQLQVATLRILIGKGIITIDEMVAEIDAVASEFPQLFNCKDVLEGATWAIDLLRGQVPLHGSIVNRHLQKKSRQKKSIGQKKSIDG